MQLVRLIVPRAALAWLLILACAFSAFAATDLRVTEVAAPASAAPGETITVVWTVTNSGDTTANASWSDRLFLAAISTPRPAIDKPLTDPLVRSALLAPGASYTRTSSVTIPADRPPATSYLIGSVDVVGQVVESDEANNSLARAISIVRPDLVASSLTAPATGAPGETVSVTWVVTNPGPGAAIGTWTDKLYLSPDGVLDIAGAAPDTVAASVPHSGPLYRAS